MSKLILAAESVIKAREPIQKVGDLIKFIPMQPSAKDKKYVW